MGYLVAGAVIVAGFTCGLFRRKILGAAYLAVTWTLHKLGLYDGPQ